MKRSSIFFLNGIPDRLDIEIYAADFDINPDYFTT